MCVCTCMSYMWIYTTHLWKKEMHALIYSTYYIRWIHLLYEYAYRHEFFNSAEYHSCPCQTDTHTHTHIFAIFLDDFASKNFHHMARFWCVDMKFHPSTRSGISSFLRDTMIWVAKPDSRMALRETGWACHEDNFLNRSKANASDDLSKPSGTLADVACDVCFWMSECCRFGVAFRSVRCMLLIFLVWRRWYRPPCSTTH